jgi:hypothetical protein
VAHMSVQVPLSRHVLAGFFVSDQSWFTEVIPPRSHAVKSLRITAHCVLSFGMKSCVVQETFVAVEEREAN